MKKCRDCGLIKRPDEFYAHSAAADGRQSRCKVCDNKARSRRFREPAKKILREWRIMPDSEFVGILVIGPVWEGLCGGEDTKEKIRTAQYRAWKSELKRSQNEKISSEAKARQ